MSNEKALNQELDNLSTAISIIKERHRQELQPAENKRREIRRMLGEIYAGFKPGDILQDGSGRKVRVTSVYVVYGSSWEGKGINILKQSSDGEERRIFDYQGFTKI